MPSWRRSSRSPGASCEVGTNDLEVAKELAPARTRRSRPRPTSLQTLIDDLNADLRHQLLPKDPNDDKDVILEVKAGEGGDESALFAGDLLRMYLRYAERQGWKTETLDATPTPTWAASRTSPSRSRRGPAGRPRCLSRLKYEGGVHRVQRVPVTESQGRIHTSAAGVLVLPEAEEVDVSIDPNDLRIDVFRSSGPGGQSVNTTDSAVRITHLPTGIVGQLPEREEPAAKQGVGAAGAARPHARGGGPGQRNAEASAARLSQVRTVDRSERVRTYNFPENRISDHRVGYKAYNLDQVLDGDLDGVVQALVDADNAAALGLETP